MSDNTNTTNTLRK